MSAIAARVLWTSLLLLATSRETLASELAFSWPDSGQVDVEVQRISVQRRVAMRWQLRWRPVEEGTRFELVDPSLRGLHAAGRELPLDDAFALSVAAIESMIPAWVVDESGHFLGSSESDVDRAATAAASLMAPDAGDDGFSSLGRQALESPGLRLEARRRAKDLWLSWVEEWVGAPLESDWVATDSLAVRYLDESMRGERIRQVVALPEIRRVQLADLRSSFEVALETGLRRQVLREARVERGSLRPLRATQRISLGDAYEETLVVFHWPDLPQR